MYSLCILLETRVALPRGCFVHYKNPCYVNEPPHPESPSDGLDTPESLDANSVEAISLEEPV